MSRKNVAIGLRQFEAQGVHELARLPGVQGSKGGRDERSSAIEIQIGQDMSLVSTMLALILPMPYLDDHDVAAAIKRWKVRRIETYSTLHNTSGDVWVGQIYEITHKLLREMGYLDAP